MTTMIHSHRAFKGNRLMRTLFCLALAAAQMTSFLWIDTAHAFRTQPTEITLRESGSPITDVQTIRVSLWKFGFKASGDITSTGAINIGAANYGGFNGQVTKTPSSTGAVIINYASDFTNFPDLNAGNFYIQIEYKDSASPITSYLVLEAVSPDSSTLDRFPAMLFKENLVQTFTEVDDLISGSGTVAAESGVTINSNNTAADAILTFGNDAGAETLRFSDATNEFVLSDDLETQGQLSGASLSIAGGGITFSNAATAIFNELGLASNFRIESDTQANMFFVDGTNNRVGIAGSSPEATLDVIGSVSGTSLSFAGGNVTVSGLGAAVFNENSQDVDFRIEGDTNANAFFVDGGTDQIGIGTNAPQATLDVVGTISGATIRVSDLSNCNTIDTDVSGNFVCGSDNATGSGLSIATGDPRYVNVAGDTMTGALAIINSAGLTASGSIRTDGNLSASGALGVEGSITFNGVTYTFPFSDGSASGKVLATNGAGQLSWTTVSSTSNSFGTGNVTAIGDPRYVNTSGDTMTGALNIVNGAGITASGGIRTDGNLASSGTLVTETGISTDADLTINADNGGADAVLTFGNDAGAETLRFSDTTNTFIFSDDLTVQGQLSGASLSVAGGGITFSDSATAIFNEFGLASNFRVESDTQTNMFFVDGTNNRVGVGTGAPEATFDVVGAISGATLRISSLSNCNTIDTDVSGNLACGTDATSSFGTGNVIAISDPRYVNTSGDTMTGALAIINSAGLTASGSIRTDGSLTASGTLGVEGSVTFNGVTYTFPFSDGSATGKVLATNGAGQLSWTTAATSNSFGTGNVTAIGDPRYVNTSGDTMTGALAIINSAGLTASGSIRTDGSLTASGTLGVEGTVTFNGVTYTFPFSDGSATGKVLATNGAGQLSWSNASVFTTGLTASGTIRTDGNLESSGSLIVSGDASAGGNMTINADNGGADAILTFGNDAGAETLRFSDTTNTFIFSDDLTVQGQLSGASLSVAGGGITFSDSATAIFNEFGLASNFRVESDTQTNMFFVDGTNNRVGIGTGAPEATFDVVGSISGASLRISGLSNCNTIDTDVSGNLVCGTDNATGSGLSLETGDPRYVNTSGDTMTGALAIINSAGLTASGSIRTDGSLTASGTLGVEGTVTFNGVTYTFPFSDGSATGKVLATNGAGQLSWTTVSSTSNSFSTGNVIAIGDPRYVNTSGDTMTGALNIVNGAGITASGGIRTDGNLASSGTLVTETGISTDADLTINADNGGADAILTFGNDAGAETLRFSDTTNTFIFSDDLTVQGQLSGASLSVAGGGITFSDSATAIFNEFGLASNFRVESDTQTNMFFVDGTNNRVGVGTGAPEATFDVVGAISGATLRISSLSNCNTIDTDASGNFVCGSDTGGSFGTGNVIAISDPRYVNTSGDTMTGALAIINSAGLTASGSIRTDGDLSASGALGVEGTVTFNGVTYTFPFSDGSASGKVLATNGAGQLSWTTGGSASAVSSGSIVFLDADYPNVVYFGSGTATTGQLNLLFDTTTKENYYRWTSTRSGIQDYWISTRVRVPNNFSTWDPGKPIQFKYRTGSASAAVNHLSIRFFDTAGTEIALTGGSGLANTSFTTANITGPQSSGTYTAGGFITILVKVAATSAGSADASQIMLHWETTTP